MQDLKEVMQRMKQKKQEKKDVHTVYKDVLAQSKAYQELLEEWNTLKAKKAQLENTLRAQCAKELEQAERLALDIKTDAQVLCDLALTMLMKGETVEVTDDYGVKHDPVFKVTFKKAE